MNRVLAANFLRLRKDKCFWATLLFMAAMGVVFPIGRYVAMKEEGYTNTLETAFFVCVIFIGFLAAILCGLFIGTEYSDGTIRNKIIAGQTRFGIYAAILVCCCMAVLIMYAAFFIPCLCVGIPLLGFFDVAMKTVLLYTLDALLLGMAFASIFTLIAMLCHSKTVSSVSCLLLIVLFLAAGTYMAQRLDAPPVQTVYSYTADESSSPVAMEVENPRYLKGTERKVYEFLFDFLPGGQVLQCASMESENPQRLAFYSGIIVIAVSAAGVFFFRKKDIR